METQRTSELGSLWMKAVKNFKEDTDWKADHLDFPDLVRRNQNIADRFAEQRKGTTRVATARSYCSKHLEDVQKIRAVLGVVSDAANSFPPAAAAGVLFSACGHVLDAFVAVKADYDIVEEFFGSTSRLFGRLSLLEQNENCRQKPKEFLECIERVFSCTLKVYAVGFKMINHKHGGNFFRALWSLEDPDLKNALAGVRIALDELSETIGMANYRVSIETQAELGEANKKLDHLESDIGDLASYYKQMGRSVDEIMEKIVSDRINFMREMHKQSTEIQRQFAEMRTQTATLQRIDTQIDTGFKEIAKVFADTMSKQAGKTLVADVTSKKKEKSQPLKPDRSDKRLLAIKDIRDFFDNNSSTFPRWRAASKNMEDLQAQISSARAPGTGDWLLQEPRFLSWQRNENRVLWIRGPKGIGKTFLTDACITHLREESKHESSAMVGHFFFSGEVLSSESISNAFATISLQFAERFARYGELLAKSLKNVTGDEILSSHSVCSLLLSPGLASSKDNPEQGSTSIFLIFDGIDDISIEQRKQLFGCLVMIANNVQSVRVLVTSRSTEFTQLRALSPVPIDIEKDYIAQDLRAVISHRIRNLSNLREFPRLFKILIAKQVRKQADSMLFADHMLRRLNYIGLVKAVVKELSHMPTTLDGLFELILSECCEKRSSTERKAIQKLFSWLAHSFAPLTQQQALALMRLSLVDEDFDIEKELKGRSASILKLSYQDPMNETLEDDYDDGNDGELGTEQDPSSVEYGEALVMFSDRSLKEYYRMSEGLTDDDIRTTASQAHLTIFEMSVQILTNVAMDVGDSNALFVVSYAANYWYDHFLAIEVEQASRDVIERVNSGIREILDNANNIARVFEQYTITEWMYNINLGSERNWVKRAAVWVEKAKALSDLNQPMRAWVDLAGTDLLRRLSRGHVDNWLNSNVCVNIRESYICAVASMKLDAKIGCFGTRKAQILAVVNHFEGIPHDWKFLRATGATLHSFNTDRSIFLDELSGSPGIEMGDEMCESQPDDTAGLENSPGHIEETSPEADPMTEDVTKRPIDYLTRSIETMSTDDPIDRVFTRWILGRAYSDTQGLTEIEAISRLTKGVTTMEEAVAVQDSELLENNYPAEFNKRNMLLEKADLLRRLGRTSESLEVYNEARKLSSDGGFGGYYLCRMTDLTETEDLMDTFRGWTEKERIDWLSANIVPRGANQQALSRLSEAANLSGSTGVEFVSSIFDSFQKTLPERSSLMISLATQRADFHRATGDMTKAKTLYREALQVEHYTEDPWNLKWFLSGLRLKLAQIIYTQFREQGRNEAKAGLLEELKTIPIPEEERPSLKLSHIRFLVAAMHRSLGLFIDYQKQMDELLNTCVDGLMDEIKFNDSTSLRLLAKILSLIPGLERDAAIALSAQAYDLYQEPEVSNGLAASDGASTFIAPDPRDLESCKVDIETGPVKSEYTTASSQHGEVDLHEYPHTIDSNTFHPPDEAIDLESEHIEDPLVQESDTTVAGTATVHPSSQVNPAKGEVLDFPVTNGGATCDGVGCDFKIANPWMKKLFVCVACADADYCEDCLAKQLQHNRGELDDWKTNCTADHAYIQAPISGWKGIRNGWIYIDNESFTVRDWLKGLQEVRWKEAWLRFWREQGALRTIEV